MKWTDKIPEEPGYYFLDQCGEEFMVEIMITGYGPRYKYFDECRTHDCYDAQGLWLGPIKSEDIINLWKSFNEEKNKS